MINTEKYVRKPLFVDAVQVTEENFHAMALWCQGEICWNGTGAKVGDSSYVPTECYIKVRTHNPKNARQNQAFVKDWILYTDRGYKVYSDRAFHGSFEQVVEDPQPNKDQLGLYPADHEYPLAP